MSVSTEQLQSIKSLIQEIALSHGFQGLRVSDTSTGEYFERFKNWVEKGLHGDMSFLERNQSLRKNPAELHENTTRVLSLRYDYLPQDASFCATLSNPKQANISRYALGRDYHKLIRKKLTKVVKQLEEELDDFESLTARVLVDSAPVLETAFAEKSGLGWKGKNTLIINESAGSWFFLGEIFINLPLPIDEPVKDQCGNCSACISLCPTDAILEGKEVDARKCVSYLTIENKGAIPIELREKIGNRIYGCDDCQLACPWNRYAQLSKDTSFQSRNNLNNTTLAELWKMNEQEFLNQFEGSPIRRIGYQSWLRNIAVAIGNSEDPDLISILKGKRSDANELVLEHIEWAISRLEEANNEADLLIKKKTEKLVRTVETMLPRDA